MRCSRRSTWAWIAASTLGWWWPRIVVAMPVAKSRYARLSVSYSR
jgi:fatty acid desaturase